MLYYYRGGSADAGLLAGRPGAAARLRRGRAPPPQPRGVCVCLSVCVRVCVCVRARACVCARARVVCVARVVHTRSTRARADTRRGVELAASATEIMPPAGRNLRRRRPLFDCDLAPTSICLTTR